MTGLKPAPGAKLADPVQGQKHNRCQ